MDIQLYDTTLRDGMQGEGMSLSADEKLRVAHRLDALGIDLIEAGFPASNPKEQELFSLLGRETFGHADIAAFGMTRRRDVAADADPALRVLADSLAPVCTLVGKTWGLHLDKVVRVDRDENLRMIAESVAFLVGQGKRVVYDAEHFFDGYADDADYALRCLRAALEAGAETVVPCDTNGGTLPDRLGATMDAVVAAVGDEVRVGIHCHDDAGCGVANSLAGVAAGATHVQGTINGYGERCGNANLVTVVPNLQLKLGHTCLTQEQLAELTDASHFLDELLNFTPNPDAPYVGRNAFAHKGGMHVAGVNEDPATFEHLDPDLVGNRRELLVSELSGRGTVRARADAAGLTVDDATVSRVIERVKELEHTGYHFEAADGSFDLLLRKEAGAYEPLFRLESWRVIVEKRADGRVETEATIKIWLDGERYVRTAEGNGPVHALDRALRAAIAEIHPHLKDIELVNFKVRILDERKGTGAITRVLLDSSDGGEVWGSIGVSENIIEASWEALVDSLEFGLQPAPDRAARVLIPLAQPVLGPREEELVLEVLRSGQLSLGPMLPAFEDGFARRLGVAHASAVSSGTAGLHLALRAVGVTDGDEVVTSPFSFVASANAIVYERATPVFVDIDPVTLNAPADAVAAAVNERTRALLPVHIFGYPADVPGLERLGLPIVEDAAEALGATFPDGVPVGARGHPAVFGFYANKQLATGEGGMVTTGAAAVKERIDSERNQGRAPNMDWLDHDRLGFNYRLSDVACALGVAQLEHLDELLADRARVAARYREALADVDPELVLPCSGPRRRRARLVRVRRAAAARPAPRRRDPCPGRARRAEQALPARDPPDVVLPRALRPSRGRVPGVRGRGRPLGGAAVLPAHDREPGGSGRPGARVGAFAVAFVAIIDRCVIGRSGAADRRAGSARSASCSPSCCRSSSGIGPWSTSRRPSPSRRPTSPGSCPGCSSSPGCCSSCPWPGRPVATRRAAGTRGPATRTPAGGSPCTCSASAWPRRSRRSTT